MLSAGLREKYMGRSVVCHNDKGYIVKFKGYYLILLQLKHFSPHLTGLTYLFSLLGIFKLRNHGIGASQRNKVLNIY